MRFLYQTLAVAWRYLAVGLTVLVLVVGVFVFRFYHRPQQAYIVHQETLAGREINFPCSLTVGVSPPAPAAAPPPPLKTVSVTVPCVGAPLIIL